MFNLDVAALLKLAKTSPEDRYIYKTTSKTPSQAHSELVDSLHMSCTLMYLYGKYMSEKQLSAV